MKKYFEISAEEMNSSFPLPDDDWEDEYLEPSLPDDDGEDEEDLFEITMEDLENLCKPMFNGAEA